MVLGGGLRINISYITTYNCVKKVQVKSQLEYCFIFSVIAEKLEKKYKGNFIKLFVSYTWNYCNVREILVSLIQ